MAQYIEYKKDTGEICGDQIVWPNMIIPLGTDETTYLIVDGLVDYTGMMVDISANPPVLIPIPQ